MTIASEITKLNTNLTNSYTAVSGKGGTLPQAQNFDNLATAISSIPSGSSSGKYQLLDRVTDNSSADVVVDGIMYYAWRNDSKLRPVVYTTTESSTGSDTIEVYFYDDGYMSLEQTGTISGDILTMSSSTSYTRDSNKEIGTVSGFFTDGNGVEYAVVCLDAQYRLASGTYCSNTSQVTNLPVYSTWALWEAKETATFNTQKILDFCTAQSATSTACTHCRSKSFTIDGTTYYGQLPNIVELIDICKNYTAIQSADTSVSQHSSLGFPRTSDRTWSSTQYASANGWYVGSVGSPGSGYKAGHCFVAPVLEIPNT